MANSRLTKGPGESIVVLDTSTISEKSARLSHSLAHRKAPVGPDEVAGVAQRGGVPIILMFRFRPPERTGRRKLRQHLPRPETRRLHVRDGILGDPLLFIAGVKDHRAIACSSVVALAVQGRRIVNLEEGF